MHPANGRWCYNVTLSLIGWAHTQMIPGHLQVHCWANLNPYLYGTDNSWKELVPLFRLSYDIIYLVCYSFVVAWNNNIFGNVIYNIATWMYDSWLPRPLWTPICAILAYLPKWHIDASAIVVINCLDKQRVLMHGHQGWNVRHGLCHIYMRYVYIYELFIAFVSFVVCPLL